MTDYFEPYDYIFGDYAYEKVRLKGFYESNNKNANKINDIKSLDDYIFRVKEYIGGKDLCMGLLAKLEEKISFEYKS